MLYYNKIVSVLFLLFVWCPCKAINVLSVQYNGGLLPDIMLLTQYYFFGEPVNVTTNNAIIGEPV